MEGYLLPADGHLGGFHPKTRADIRSPSVSHKVNIVKTASPQGTTLGPLEDLGWTTLSITVALALLPALGVKALGQSMFPKAAKASNAEERHYLIQ
ncbi:hypothetical protein CXX84_03340 [Arthrobacter sp. AFG7.2]|nr:hypothetical protein CXX84_03340 [Arthrobacter sp. AFG7.2]